MTIDRIAEIWHALHAAEVAPDEETRAIFVAVARSRHVALVSEVQRLTDHLLERERALAPVKP